ncbi:MAG TPA: IS982 family transposase [Gemmataceae bacterium]|nr:IS982 family transposase [Gemmataceae bacterium]
MTIVVMYHGSHFQDFKAFYRAYVQRLWQSAFPQAPCYERFITLQGRILVPLTMFLSSRMGQKTGIYYVDSTSLPVCHNKRISRHRVFAGLAARGKTSMGWFFGFKLHLVFNHLREIVAIKITRGNVHDAAALPELSRDLAGKIFGDKGYLGKKLADELLRRGLALMTRVRKNMKALPMSLLDKLLLNGRNIAETIIGNIKEFSSLNLPRHRSVTNAFVHLIAALTNYQMKPLTPKSENPCLFNLINS